MRLAVLPRTPLIAVGLLIAATITGLVFYWPDASSEAQLAPSLRGETYEAEVVGVTLAECEVPQPDSCRRVEARLAAGPEAGRVTSFPTSDSPAEPDFEPGDQIRLTRADDAAVQGQGLDRYSFVDYERRSPMLVLLLIFAGVIVVFGRLRGLLSLIGLGASIGVITAFLIPAILAGRPSVPVAIVAALAVMFLTLALAHGVGPKTVAAALGTSASLLLTAGLAIVFTNLANITGFSSEEAVLLQGAEEGISLQGLVLAGMVIGALGVLDDVTVSQASAVMALRRANPALPARRLYREAIEIGRDHVAATVNTLVLAYVGASLPILLVFSVGDTPFGEAVNREAVSEQVVGTLVGSIGLIAAVPLTTAMAAWLAVRMTVLPPADSHVH